MARWTALLLLGLGLVALTSGCRRRGHPLHDARHLARYERQLMGLAARQSACAPGQVQPTRVGERVWTAQTCRGSLDYELACRGRRCRWRRIASVAEAAQPLLGCPAPAIRPSPTAQPGVRDAVGCGRAVRMTLGCNAVGCGWVATGAPSSPRPGSGPVIYVPAR